MAVPEAPPAGARWTRVTETARALRDPPGPRAEGSGPEGLTGIDHCLGRFPDGPPGAAGPADRAPEGADTFYSGSNAGPGDRALISQIDHPLACWTEFWRRTGLPAREGRADAPARLPAHGGPEFGRLGCLGARGHGSDGPQDPLGV